MYSLTIVKTLTNWAMLNTYVISCRLTKLSEGTPMPLLTTKNAEWWLLSKIFLLLVWNNCWHMWCDHLSFQYTLTLRNNWKMTFLQRQPNCIVLGTSLYWWPALTHREADSGHCVQGPTPLLLQRFGGGGHRWHLHPHQRLCHYQAAIGLADLKPDLVRRIAESQLLLVSTVLSRPL